MTLALVALGLPCAIGLLFVIECWAGVRRLTKNNHDLIDHRPARKMK